MTPKLKKGENKMKKLFDYLRKKGLLVVSDRLVFMVLGLMIYALFLREIL